MTHAENTLWVVSLALLAACADAGSSSLDMARTHAIIRKHDTVGAGTEAVAIGQQGQTTKVVPTAWLVSSLFSMPFEKMAEKAQTVHEEGHGLSGRFWEHPAPSPAESLLNKRSSPSPAGSGSSSGSSTVTDDSPTDAADTVGGGTGGSGGSIPIPDGDTSSDPDLADLAVPGATTCPHCTTPKCCDTVVSISDAPTLTARMLAAGDNETTDICKNPHGITVPDTRSGCNLSTTIPEPRPAGYKYLVAGECDVNLVEIKEHTNSGVIHQMQGYACPDSKLDVGTTDPAGNPTSKFPKGGLEYCAKAVAANPSCGDLFQMTADYECKCVVSARLCGPHEMTKENDTAADYVGTCIYELAPETAAAAAASHGSGHGASSSSSSGSSSSSSGSSSSGSSGTVADTNSSSSASSSSSDSSGTVADTASSSSGSSGTGGHLYRGYGEDFTAGAPGHGDHGIGG